MEKFQHHVQSKHHEPQQFSMENTISKSEIPLEFLTDKKFHLYPLTSGLERMKLINVITSILQLAMCFTVIRRFSSGPSKTIPTFPNKQLFWSLGKIYHVSPVGFSENIFFFSQKTYARKSFPLKQTQSKKEILVFEIQIK